ncbi:DsbA family protein [archaeon]|nr:DsbA family protein [archaeon]NCQ50496.1 DsbA family protein [archaeon]
MTKKENNLMYIKILLGAILAVLVLLLVLNLSNNNKTADAFLKETTSKTDNQANHFLGNEDAPLVMYEYSSFTCPFCKRYQIDDQTFETIKKEYIDTGKIKYVYQHFVRNEIDIKAANAAECAGEQDMFFEYKKKLYENQTDLPKEEFSKYAQELDLDVTAFESCLAENKYVNKITQDKQDGVNKGISGTPGFIVGNQRISGAQDYQVFKAAIDEQL